MRLNVIGFKLKPDDLSIINKIMSSIINKSNNKEIEYKVYDIASITFGETIYPTVIFGEASARAIEIPKDQWKIILPDIKKLHGPNEDKKLKEKTKKELNKIIEFINRKDKNIDDKKEEEKTISFLEKEDINNKQVSFGKIADICLSDSELDYLRKLKELLNGNRIIIKKGETSIEIE